MLVLGLLVGALCAWPVRAAIELEYYRATSTDSSVLLEWRTISEFNLSGFEILCKQESEPDSEYHPIGARVAQGGPNVGADYSLNVTTGVYFGTSYCFRLVERTTDGTPGEQFDICGYGPGVTPTPVFTQTVVSEGAFAGTPTAIIVEAPAGATPAPTLEGTVEPAATATFVATITPEGPSQPVSPLGSPTVTSAAESASSSAAGTTPVVTAGPTPTWTLVPTIVPAAGPSPEVTTQPASPLVTPDGQTQSMQDTSGESGTGVQVTVTSTAPMSTTATPTLVPTATQESTPTETPSPTAMPASSTPETPVTDAGAPAVAIGATATPVFVVVTATPTPDALAVAAPTFTPWPTVTPTPQLGMLNLLAPNAQNLMVMLLCLLFMSATGLGTLGLVTSIIYIRSQANRDRSRLPGPYYGRRRPY